MRLLRRVLVYGTGVAVLLIGAIAAAYFVGIKLPVYAATTPVAFQNWNQTRTVKANLLHDSLVWRVDGRTHLTVNLQMPKAVKRLKAFLDGGRTELVACGPQKLYLHSLLNGKLRAC